MTQLQHPVPALSIMGHTLHFGVVIFFFFSCSLFSSSPLQLCAATTTSAHRTTTSTSTTWDIDTGYLAHLVDKTSGHEGISAYALDEASKSNKLALGSEISPVTLLDGVRYNDLPDTAEDGLTKKVKSALSFGAEFAWQHHVGKSPWITLMEVLTEEDQQGFFKGMFSKNPKPGRKYSIFLELVCRLVGYEAKPCDTITNLSMHIRNRHSMWSAFGAHSVATYCPKLTNATPDLKEWCARVNATRKSILVESLAANSHFGCRQHWHGMAPVAFQGGKFFRFTNRQVAGQIETQLRKWWDRAMGEYVGFALKRTSKQMQEMVAENAKQLKEARRLGLSAHNPNVHNEKQSVFSALKQQVKEVLGSKKHVNANGDFEIGQILHVIQDSWSAPHAIRNGPGCGEVFTFQGYGLQDSDKHGADDHNPNFANTEKKEGLRYRRHLWHCAEQQSQQLLEKWWKCKSHIHKRAFKLQSSDACKFPQELVRTIFKVNSAYADKVAGGTRDVYLTKDRAMLRMITYEGYKLEETIEVTYPEDAPPQGCSPPKDECSVGVCVCRMKVIQPPYAHDMVYLHDSTMRMPSQPYEGVDDADIICAEQS
jgi:hypothetical protein